MEADLFDRCVLCRKSQLEESPEVTAGADVRGRVVGEDVDQLAGALDQLAEGDLRSGVAHEVLLAGIAAYVRVGVAVADVLERTGTAHLLIARPHVDRGVLLPEAEARVVVEVATVHVRVHAPDLVDRLLETAEVDVDVVVDLEVSELLDGLDRELRAAERVGGVDLVRPVTWDRNLQVTRQRQKRDPPLGVDTHQDDRVRAWLQATLLVTVATVRSGEHDRLRASPVWSYLATDVDVRELLDGPVEEEKRARRRRRRGEHDDHPGPDREALKQCAGAASPDASESAGRNRSMTACSREATGARATQRDRGGPRRRGRIRQPARRRR